MKQTIEIEVPDGKKAVWKDGKIIFENVRPNLPKTWEEFCKNYSFKKEEVFIDDSSIITFYTSGNRDKYADQNVLPNEEAAKNHLVLMQLHQLRDCYRQGWIPDWNNNLQYKYIIYIERKQIMCFANTTTSRFLSFQSREIAEEFLNNFKDLIEQAGDLI